LQTRGEADAVFARWLYDPRGKITGLWLDDGTLLESSPAQAAALREEMRPGDRLHVRRATGSAVSIVDVDRNVHVNLGPQVRARGGGLLGHDGAAWSGLEPHSDSAPLRAVGYDVEGKPRVLLLDDGAQIHIPPRAAELARGLRIGTPLEVQGYSAPGTTRAAWGARIVESGGHEVFDLSH
jgi:hypothetical protein